VLTNNATSHVACGLQTDGGDHAAKAKCQHHIT